MGDRPFCQSTPPGGFPRGGFLVDSLRSGDILLLLLRLPEAAAARYHGGAAMPSPGHQLSESDMRGLRRAAEYGGRAGKRQFFLKRMICLQHGMVGMPRD